MSTPTTQVSDYTTLEDWSKDQAVQGNRSYADWLWSTGAVKDATSQYPVWVVPCEIRSTTNNAGTLLTLDNDAEAQIALSIEAANTTATVISAVGCDSLTTAGIAAFTSNSSSTATRTLFNVKNDHTLAANAIPIVAENDSTSVCIQALSNAAGAVGAQLELSTKSASGADGDVIGRILFRGDSEEQTAGLLLGQIDVVMTDATAGSYASQMNFYTATGAAQNESMRILAAGSVSVDASSGSSTVDLFDHLEGGDALALSQMSTDHPAFIAQMLEEGIYSPKAQGVGYMRNIIKFENLLAGGIYQLQWQVDAQYETQNARIQAMEETLSRLSPGTVVDVEGSE
jgi:hypothetical protein